MSLDERARRATERNNAMHEDHEHSSEEHNMVAAEIHHQVLEAVYGILKGKGDCAGCYSDAITIGMADALAQVIVDTRRASAVDATVEYATDRIVGHVAILQGHHLVDHNDYR
jgi:hypothetical protein